MKKQNKGFTLVELLIVIVIIGILAAIIVPSVSSAIEKANLANDQSDVKNMNTLIALEAIERNADYLEALEVQNILKEQGYDLVPQAKGYVFLYDTSENRIFLEKEEKLMNAIKTNAPLATTKAINGVYAANGNTDPYTLEAVVAQSTNIFYIDKGDRDLTKAIDTIRNLGRETEATIESAYTNALGYVSDELKSHFESFNPAFTLYITEKGFIGGTMDGNKTSGIQRVYIAADVAVIPVCNLNAIEFATKANEGEGAVNFAGAKYNNVNAEGNGTLSINIDLPRSVANVEIDAFTSIKGGDVTIVVNGETDLSGYRVASHIKVKGSSNVSTMRTINVQYVYVGAIYNDAETPAIIGYKDITKPLKVEQKNYLPFSFKLAEGVTKGEDGFYVAATEGGQIVIETTASGAGRFVVDTDSIKSLITAKSEVVVKSTFDKRSGFNLLSAYIKNEDGTLAAGVVLRYMFVEQK